MFSDDFSEAPGTLIVGKAADVGGNWTGTGDANTTLAISDQNSVDTSGAGRALFDTFSSSLGAGQVLTLTYDTLTPSTGNFLAGWAGVSLYTTNGSEVIFTGDPSAGAWGTDGSAIGRHNGADTNTVNSVVFTYVHDTGSWSFNTLGYSTSGAGTAGLPLGQLRIANGAGGDINVDNIVVDISASTVFDFYAQTPAPGSYSALVTNPISVQTIDGSFPVNTNTIVMKLDGGTVTPDITKISNVTTISYAPGSPLSEGTLYSVLVTLADTSGAEHTNSWSFTTGHAALPVVFPGPITDAYVTNGAAGITILSAAGEGWLGNNYDDNSSRRLYTRYSMVFHDLNNETGDGGGYGGLHFFQDTAEKLIAGNAWIPTNWSASAAGNTVELTPLLPVTLEEWHTIVVRTDYVPGGQDNVSIWLDPVFSETELYQPNPPLMLTADVSFNNVRLRCGNGSASASWSNIIVAATSAGVGFKAPADPEFQNYIPAVDAPSASVSTPIGVDVSFGMYEISTNSITMTLDGDTVKPNFTVTAGYIGMSYQPPNSFAPGSVHSVMVSLTDLNGTPYFTSWSFTVDSYPTLPVSLTGPIDVTAGLDVTIWNAQNGWIDGNYGPDSTKTLYTRFSMTFYDFPQTDPGAGGSYGGLHFFQDSNERLIVGNAWGSTNWSADAKEAGQLDLLPATPINAGDWHTIVIKSVYSSNAPTAESIWLDPDFTKSLSNQPQPPLTASMNNTFNQVRLRCGNGSTFAEYTDITIAATAEDLGFPASEPPGMLSIQNGQLFWTGGGTLQHAPAVTGPWTDAANQSNPQELQATNEAEFYRLHE